jgi:hypothetical protein
LEPGKTIAGNVGSGQQALNAKQQCKGPHGLTLRAFLRLFVDGGAWDLSC